MAKKTQSKPKGESVSIVEISRETIDICIVGDSPLICNAMSEKAKRQIILPPPRKKNSAERQQTLKHDPVQEYRDSIYTLATDQPTLIGVLPTAFKNALRCAAVDVPGATKAQLGRLTFVEGTMIPIYGRPYLVSGIVRLKDRDRTPDVRTRAILPEWACRISITFATPMLNHNAVVSLLAAAGVMQGIGDWRPEKGNGDYGRFQIVPHNDPDFLRITKDQARPLQVEAMNKPVAFDDETAKLLSWFDEEIERRDAHKLLNRKEIAA